MFPRIIVLFVIFFFFHFHSITCSDPDSVQDFCVPETRHPVNRTGRFTVLPCKNSSEATVEDFVFDGIKTPGKFNKIGFAGVSVNVATFPGLNTLGMSFVRADLDIKGVNVPHFHPRATEIAYVLEGMVYSGFVDSTNRVFSKILRTGEVMIYPKGLVHFQMNVGDSPATIYGCFNSQNPGLQKIPTAIFGSGIKGVLLEKAFGLSAKDIEMLKRKLRP